jgi:membrane protein DedA with SNARE-associated domain
MLGTAGIPFPSASVLLASGVLVQQGHLNLAETIAFGVLGAIVGNQIGYWVGHRSGKAFLLKWGRYVRLTPERLDRVDRFVTHEGGKAVFAARFFSVSRLLEALVAGMSRMRWGSFSFYSVLGGAVWVTAVVLAGYSFGQAWGKEQLWSRLSPLLVVVLFGAASIFYLAYRWVSSHRSR